MSNTKCLFAIIIAILGISFIINTYCYDEKTEVDNENTSVNIY